MTDFTDYEKSAILSLVAGIIFISVAALELTSDGEWVVIVLNGVVGALLLLDGGRRLWRNDQSETA